MSEENNNNVFHPYPSTTALRSVAYAFCALIIIAAIVISTIFFNQHQVLVGVLIIIGGIMIAILSVAWVLVFLNMSDDLKLLGEEVAEMKCYLINQNNASMSFFDATNKLMQSQLGELEDISDRQAELLKALTASQEEKTEA